MYMYVHNDKPIFNLWFLLLVNENFIVVRKCPKKINDLNSTLVLRIWCDDKVCSICSSLYNIHIWSN